MIQSFIHMGMSYGVENGRECEVIEQAQGGGLRPQAERGHAASQIVIKVLNSRTGR